MTSKKGSDMPKIYGRRIVNEKRIKSYWPNWVRRLFETLKEIPWLSLTAVSTLLGALILFIYFQSIDHFPSDFSALIGLGAAASVSALALVVALAIGLFAPAAVYQHYYAEEKNSASEAKKFFTEYELVFLQLGGVGVVLSHIAYAGYRDCGNVFIWYGIVGTVLLVLGIVSFLRILGANGGWRRRLARSFTACAIATMTLAPFLVLIPLRELFASPMVDSSAALLTLWALAILVNAATATQLPGVAIAVVAVMLSGFLYMGVPLMTDRPNFFPTMVASFLGVRDEIVQDLRVPKRTCALVMSALGATNKSNNVRCSEAEWGEVRAQVLSKEGLNKS